MTGARASPAIKGRSTGFRTWENTIVPIRSGKEMVIVANRRMFSMDVINTDMFMEMPISAQCLYFHLGMRADDDGFISTPRLVIKIVNCTNDDLKILISKGYVIPFETGVVVIRHWRQNNYVRCDRYTKSRHTEELQSLLLENGVYNVGIPCDIPLDDTDKIRLDKIRIDKTRKDIISPEPEQNAEAQSGILLPLNDKTTYDVPEPKISMWAETYPAVDVRQELRKMAAWLDSNPTKRKTRRGIERFINSWLSRQQDRGGTYGQRQQASGQPPASAELPREYQEMYADLGKGPSLPDSPFQ